MGRHRAVWKLAHRSSRSVVGSSKPLSRRQPATLKFGRRPGENREGAPDLEVVDGAPMEPRWNLDLRRMCRTPHCLACSMTIEQSAKARHLQRVCARSCEVEKADDGSRTRDLRLGKPTLYQLSYVRRWRGC